MDFSEIAKIMTKRGHKMNHATARNYYLRGMKKILKPLKKAFSSKNNISNMLLDSRITYGMMLYLEHIYEEEEKEIKNEIF